MTERFLEKEVLPRFTAVKDWIDKQAEDEGEDDAVRVEEGAVGGQPEQIEMVQQDEPQNELPPPPGPGQLHIPRSKSAPRNFRPTRVRKNPPHPPSAPTNVNTSDVTWFETFGLFVKVLWQIGTNCYSLDFMALLESV